MRHGADCGNSNRNYCQSSRNDYAKRQSTEFGGIVYTESAEKTAYFIENCNRYNTPILFVQDVSGFMVGAEAEHSGIIRAGARFVEAMATATVPKLVLTINHASGAGYYAMAGQGFDPDFIFSLPSGRMGVMEGDSAAVAIYGTQIEKLKQEGKEPDAEMLAEMDEVRETMTKNSTQNMRRRVDLWTRLLRPIIYARR